MSFWTPTAMASEPERERAISSQRTAVVRKSAPAPPYFSSYSTPRKPSTPMRGQMDFGICPACSHSSMWGATSLSTKVRTDWRNISCCSSKIFTLPPFAPLRLDRLAVHRPLRAAREGIGEDHHLRPLEPRDLRDHVIAHGLRGVGAGVLHLHHRLDRLAPPGVRDSVHADPGHAGHLHDDGLDLGGVDVLASGLDQLLLGLPLDVVEVALVVEAPHVPRVVPPATERVGGDVGLGEVALEHERAPHHDLARRARREVAV